MPLLPTLLLSFSVLIAAAPNRTISSAKLTVGLSLLDGLVPRFDILHFFGAGALTSNLGDVKPAGDKNGGGTQSAPAGHSGGTGGTVPVCAAPACSLSSDASTVVLAGLTTPALASNETWTLSLLNATAFSLRVDRQWAAGAPPISVDRVFFTFATTGGLPIHAEQVPSWVDLDMFFNDTSTGGFDVGSGLATGTYDTGSAYEYLSPNARQYLRFSPTGATFVVEGAATLAGAVTPLLFSFAKPFSDGTVWCSVGFEAVDPRGAPRPPPAPGARQTLEMTWSLIASDVPVTRAAAPAVPAEHAFPQMDFSLPNETLAEQVQTLMGAQYQLMGYIFGNNPASTPCLHEMAWWPLQSSLFSADSIALSAMKRELSFFAKCGWQPAAWNGDYEPVHSCNVTAGAAFGLQHRYNAAGFYGCPWGPLTDQDVMFPIAVYYLASSTGDVAWLTSMRPALDAVASFLASRGLSLPPTGAAAAAPVVYKSPASGLADGMKHAGNWYDIVEFGNFDALLAAYGVWGVQSLADIYSALGDADASARMAAIHTRAVADYNTLFWREERSAYADWIDIQGHERAYFYVDIAFVSIIAGIASPAQTTALLSHYDARLAEMYSQYNVSAGTIWSPPSNMYAITNELEFAFCQGGCAPGFPTYENGGSFFHSAGLQFAALGAAGRADDAVAGFVALINSGFGAIRGWAQQLYWQQNQQPAQLVGFDPLNTAALAVWGLFRAGFGVEPSLTGIVAVGAPAASFEGARWNVSSLGATVCLTVRGGKTVQCDGTALRGARGSA